MTTHQLYLNRDNRGQNSSGVAVLFFLLGAPNIYSALRQRSQTSAAPNKSPMWAVGLGILAFATVGAWSCLNAIG